jgi:succinate dehydrogenase/fumarate reductase cytochrome b subunit
VEALFVYAPLALHAGIGLWLVVTRMPLAQPSPYPPGVRVAMRATGVVVAAFLAMHLPEVRFRSPFQGGARPGSGELLTVLASDLSSTWHGVPWRAVAYLAAAGCIAFHFAAGLWGFFATSWGASARARRLRRGAAWGAAIVGSSVWLLLTDVIVLHATGTRLIGAPAPSPAPTGGDCPRDESHEAH